MQRRPYALRRVCERAASSAHGADRPDSRLVFTYTLALSILD
jgi:hypothetical protein